MSFFRNMVKRVFGSTSRPYEERYYSSTDGLKLFYRDYGGATSRTPVLCIPGLTRNSRDFEFIAFHLAKSRRVLTADLRGRGKSEYAKDPRHYAAGIEAADMVRLLGDAEVSKVIVLGTSRGGVVAMTLAATRPDLLQGVILNDIGGEIEAPGFNRILEFMGREKPLASWSAAVEGLKKTYSERFPGVEESRWLGFAQAIYRESEGQITPDYDARLGDATRQLVPNFSSDSANLALWPLFASLAQVPTLVLRGENSDLLSAATVKRMRSAKKDLADVTVRNRGHPPFLNEPEAISAIERFLDEMT